MPKGTKTPLPKPAASKTTRLYTPRHPVEKKGDYIERREALTPGKR